MSVNLICYLDLKSQDPFVASQDPPPLSPDLALGFKSPLLLICSVLPGLPDCTHLVIHRADVKEVGVLPLHLLDAEVLHDMGADLLLGLQPSLF